MYWSIDDFSQEFPAGRLEMIGARAGVESGAQPGGNGVIELADDVIRDDDGWGVEDLEASGSRCLVSICLRLVGMMESVRETRGRRVDQGPVKGVGQAVEGGEIGGSLEGKAEVDEGVFELQRTRVAGEAGEQDGAAGAFGHDHLAMGWAGALRPDPTSLPRLVR